MKFTLVSEPPEDEQDAECEDVGYAFVSIRDILRNRKDIVEEDIDSKWFCHLMELCASRGPRMRPENKLK